MITYAKNVFVPLTTACSNHCTYCQFRDPLAEANIMSLAEIKSVLNQAKQAGCREALFTCGSQPAKLAGFQAKLQAETDFDSVFNLLLAACREALQLGLLPHSNPGVISDKQLAELARYNASLGLMLETTAEVPAHEQSPTKQPEVRAEFIAAAGRLKIPFTSGILMGIGETRADRITSLEVLAELQAAYGHLQEVIIQPVEPPAKAKLDPLEITTVIDTLQLAREILPSDIALQVPPNLVDLKRVIAGPVDDLGGISPLTPDYINPDHNWPQIKELETEFPGYEFVERLPVYPQYITEKWLAKPVLNCLQSEGWWDEFKTKSSS